MFCCFVILTFSEALRQETSKKQHSKEYFEQFAPLRFPKSLFSLFPAPLQYGNLDHLRINDGELSLVQYLCLDVVVGWALVLLLLPVVLLTITR